MKYYLKIPIKGYGYDIWTAEFLDDNETVVDEIIYDCEKPYYPTEDKPHDEGPTTSKIDKWIIFMATFREDMHVLTEEEAFLEML